MRTKDVILSFASAGREPYHQMLLRLIDSCIEHWHGDMLVYSPDHELHEYRGVTINKGWPQPKGIKSYTHQEMPYQFKTAMIQLALEQGYERIIWLDSSMIVKKDLRPLFDTYYGVTTFHNLGHDTWQYISDSAIAALENIGFTYPDIDIKRIPQIWGGAFAINFTNALGRESFEAIKAFSVNGSFKNSGSSRKGFIAHRHDQSVMSVLLYLHNNMLPYGNILCPPHDTDGTYGTDPYLVCRGL
jgi:hypothetical protein